MVVIAINVVVLGSKYTPIVKVEAVQAAPLDLMVRAPGILQPAKNVVIKAEFDGPVIKKIYKEGDKVRAGQKLLEIGRDSIQMEHMGKINEFQNAQRELKKAVNEVRLQKTLYRKKAVAMAAVEEAKQALERARQALDISSAAYCLAQERWNKNIIYAPFNGTVTRDGIGADPAVSAGKEMLSIGDLSLYSMQVKIDELDIAQVKEGQAALVRLQAFEEKPLKARVSRVAAQSDEKGIAQYSVTLDIDREASADLPLRPQFGGEGRIMVGRTESVISAPLSALAMKDGKQIVWAVNSLGRLQAQPVDVGRSNAERVEITKGLAAGMALCTAVRPAFAQGMRVKTP